MNKYERRLKGLYKYKKRLRNYGFEETDHYVLRSTGKPCSCYLCSPGKFEVKAKYQDKLHKDHHSVKLY